VCEIDDQLKVVIIAKLLFVFKFLKTRKKRNKFLDDATGILKSDYESHYSQLSFKTP